jgi:hypothetical protein
MEKIFYILILKMFISLTFAIAQDMNNVIYIKQVGNVNLLKAEQIGYKNKAGFYQHGSDNTVGNIQYGHENHAYIQQLGNGNLFKIEQFGNENHMGADGNSFIQLGDGNKFAGVTKSNSLTFDENGYAIQNDAAELDIDSYQIGDNNVIGLRQGTSDIGQIKQFGDGNNALLWQDGGGQNAVLLQTGNKNAANVIQK